MAAVLPTWPHDAAAKETRVGFRGGATMHVHDKPHDQPCSVRLHGDLILSHWSGKVGVKELDHRLEVEEPAALESDEDCTDLILGMLANALATAGYDYDLAAENWVDSSTALTPLDIAMGIVRRFREEIEKGVATGLEFEIELPELWVTLDPKALLLAWKEAAGIPAPGRRESSEPCAICIVDEDAGNEEETVTLPCSHAFHSGCILKWFHWALTCPICRRDYGVLQLSDGPAST